MEVASALTQQGLEVTVVSPDSLPFKKILDNREFIAFYIKGDRVLAAASSKRDMETAAIYELMRLDRMPLPDALRDASVDFVTLLGEKG